MTGVAAVDLQEACSWLGGTATRDGRCRVVGDPVAAKVAILSGRARLDEPLRSLAHAMNETPRRPVSTEAPSRFWAKLSAEHNRQVTEDGVANFKRKQALRYFTWRWRPRAMLRSEQLRFLVRHTRPHTWAHVLRDRIAVDEHAWEGTGFSRGERRLTVIATRLLWAYAELHDGCTEVLRLEEPALGNPLPVYWRKRLISQDLANCALEASAISRALAGRVPTSIVEVGGGYGRTAYAMLSKYPEARYTIIDIEPARTISRWYLSQLFAAERLRFLSPEEAEKLPERTFDLAISISSLQEMRPEQVATYLRLLDRTVAGGTVYLKQWERWQNPEDEVELRFRDYPVPERWQMTLDEAAPVQTRFLQAAWRVP